MNTLAIAALIDAAAKLSVVIGNAIGSDAKSAELIEARKASGNKDWAPEALAEVEGLLQSSKAYAKGELDKP